MTQNHLLSMGYLDFLGMSLQLKLEELRGSLKLYVDTYETNLH